MTQADQRVSREALLAAAVLIYNRGLTIGTVGNISVREGDNLVITPTRRYFDELEPADLILAPIAVFADPQSPALISREWRMHAAVYAASPETHTIAHTTALTRSRAALTQRLFASKPRSVPISASTRSRSYPKPREGASISLVWSRDTCATSQSVS